jgi:formylglycine-generating enzyme required for sulfatase activity
MGRLRSKVNMLFDLPTEAQWEYACRAGTGTALNNGKNITVTGSNLCPNLDEVAWYYPRSGSSMTTVGRFLPNAFGVYDMHGNVTEWCLDGYKDNLGTANVVDPCGIASGTRVTRGGSFLRYWSTSKSGTPEYNRSASRFSCGQTSDHSEAYNWVGFRVVCLPAE